MTVKAIFRWLCAELDGFYVKSCVLFLNNVLDDIKELFHYMKNMQIIPEDESSTEIPCIKEDDLYGIGVIAGVIIPYITAESTAGSFRFTSSKIVNGKQYSHQGLFNRTSESFEFFWTDGVEHTGDINQLASKTLQTSVVESGADVLGYIEMGTDVLDSEGYVDESKILSTPPSTPYSSYYGNKYLHTPEEYLYQAKMPFATYFLLFKVMQQIRYQGASIKLFADLTETILADYITGIYFTYYPSYTIVHYSKNESSTLANKIANIYVWEALIKKKFPRFILEELST